MADEICRPNNEEIIIDDGERSVSKLTNSSEYNRVLEKARNLFPKRAFCVVRFYGHGHSRMEYLPFGMKDENTRYRPISEAMDHRLFCGFYYDELEIITPLRNLMVTGNNNTIIEHSHPGIDEYVEILKPTFVVFTERSYL